MADVQVVLLSRTETEDLVKLAQEAGEKFYAYVLRLHEGEAWRVLGYKSWTAFVDEGLNIGRSQSYRLLQKAKAEREGVALPEPKVREIGARDMPRVVAAVKAGRTAEDAYAEVKAERASVTRSRFNDGGGALAGFEGFADDEPAPAPAHEHLWTVCRVCGEARA